MGKQIILVVILLLLVQIIPASGQWRKDDKKTEDKDGTDPKIKPLNLIDNPTANRISAGEFQVGLRVYHDGGMLGGLTAGLKKNLLFGIAYGGQNLIGQGAVKWNESPGVHIRYILMPERYQKGSRDESKKGQGFPAIAIGFDSQGQGTYYPDLKRYQIKSKGVYLVISGNLILLNNFGLHAGINYSSENKGAEKDINFFCGAHLKIDEEISLIWDYDFATNDNDDKSLGSGRGYMNAALRWFFSGQFALEFSIKNLLSNNRIIGGEKIPNANRELKIMYFETIAIGKSNNKK